MDWMKKYLESMDNKLDRIDSRMDTIEKEQVKLSEVAKGQAEDLKVHIQRTNALEDKLVPIHNKYHQFIGVSKFIVGTGIFLGIVKIILELIKFH